MAFASPAAAAAAAASSASKQRGRGERAVLRSFDGEEEE
jgi:hypothetical protein